MTLLVHRHGVDEGEELPLYSQTLLLLPARFLRTV